MRVEAHRVPGLDSAEVSPASSRTATSPFAPAPLSRGQSVASTITMTSMLQLAAPGPALGLRESTALRCCPSKWTDPRVGTISQTRTQVHTYPQRGVSRPPPMRSRPSFSLLCHAGRGTGLKIMAVLSRREQSSTIKREKNWGTRPNVLIRCAMSIDPGFTDAWDVTSGECNSGGQSRTTA
ncbi:hypothetical protein LXA43DRAFT_1102078 [Ganoderma leucocontextum]|nr:hypothetical protein LXA43DRAFT_1102078 [Ganoderma leucocontextum]